MLGELKMRQACPEDVKQVAPLIYESSPDLIDYSFKFNDIQVIDYISYEFLQGQGILGYFHQYVVETSDGKIVATITAYPGKKLGRLVLHSLAASLKYFGWNRFVAIVRRMLLISRLFKSPRFDGIFLANACVLTSFRSRGIFPVIMQYAVERVGQGSPENKARVVELDVSISNERAQRLYERLGFRVVTESASRGGVAGFRRMEKSLSP